MSRSIVVSLTALALVLGITASVLAASPPSGTVTCTVTGDDDRPNGNWRLRFSPWLSADPSARRVRVSTYMRGTCDGSGVVGANAPITAVEAHLVGKLEAGSSCATFTTAPVFTKLALKIAWKTLGTDSRLHTVAKTSAAFIDANWDDGLGGLVLASAPLRGAFGGSTATVKISIDQPASFGADCENLHLVIDGAAYGADGESSLTIP
jgi:hypothetical protein